MEGGTDDDQDNEEAVESDEEVSDSVYSVVTHQLADHVTSPEDVFANM